MHDQLHAARNIEEPLDHQMLAGGDEAQHGSGGGEIGDDLAGCIDRDAGRVDQPAAGIVGLADG